MFIKVTQDIIKLVRSPTKLNYGEVLLLAHIKGIGKVYVTNEALAELMNTSVRSIKRWLHNLQEQNLILIYYEKQNEIDRRIIVPNLAP